MSADAVTARLRMLDELLAAQSLRPRGLDMSGEAVTARLKVLGALSDMCRKLAEVGRHSGVSQSTGLK